MRKNFSKEQKGGKKMNIEEARKIIKRLLIKEAKKIFRSYHLDITKYGLEEMSDILINKYDTANRRYDGNIYKIIFASKENKILRKKSKDVTHKVSAKIAISEITFVYADNKLVLYEYRLTFN